MKSSYEGLHVNLKPGFGATLNVFENRQAPFILVEENLLEEEKNIGAGYISQSVSQGVPVVVIEKEGGTLLKRQR